MRFALPIALVLCLVAVIALSPHIEPQRLRSRARSLSEQLRDDHGFREGSKAAWTQARALEWPPFHYGGRRELDGLLIGERHGLPMRVAGYEVVFNGSRHRYGLALITLPYSIQWMEVRGERPFSATRVAEHVPDGQLKLGVAEFDASWTVYAEATDAQRPVDVRELAPAMLGAPTRFSWRTDGAEILLWKRDGWLDAAQLFTSVDCVIQLLGLEARDRRTAA